MTHHPLTNPSVTDQCTWVTENSHYTKSQKSNRNSTIFFLALTNIWPPNHGYQRAEFPIRFSTVIWQQNPMEEARVSGSYGDTMPGKIHNQKGGSCPRPAMKALVKAHRNSRLQTQAFHTKRQNYPLGDRSCTVTEAYVCVCECVCIYIYIRKNQLLQYKIKWQNVHDISPL